MTPRAGLLLSTDRGVLFLAAPVAHRVVALGPITPVMGLVPPAAGVALCEGRIVTVVALASTLAAGRAAVLCEVRRDAIAIAGGEILSAGLFEPSAGAAGVLHEGREVGELDIEGLYAELEASLLSARALRHARRSVDSIRARSMPPASGVSSRAPRPSYPGPSHPPTAARPWADPPPSDPPRSR